MSSEQLKNFPITFFAIALGFAGFTLAVQKSEDLYALSHVTSTSLLAITVTLFAVTGLVYIAKSLFHYESVKAELNHPVKINFFPLVAKVLLVLSIIFLSRNMRISKYMWLTGMALQFFASLTIISAWLHHTHFKIEHLTPAWFIPVVGSLIIPIAGVKHGYVEMSWFFFSIGIIFWLTLFIVVFYRMIFHPPIMQKLLPTLFILFAPPAIAFIAYSKLTGGLDSFGRILYYFSLFLFILVLFKANIFIRIKFYLSWWAYSFPLAAITLSSVQMYHFNESGFYRNMIVFKVALLSVIIIALSYLTIRNIIYKRICVEED